MAPLELVLYLRANGPINISSLRNWVHEHSLAVHREAKLSKQSSLAEGMEENAIEVEDRERSTDSRRRYVTKLALNFMERSPELEELTRKLYAAVSHADAGFFERYLSRGESCVVIGTAPDEWWDDYAAALDPIRRQMAAVGNAVELVAGDVRAYRRGEAGWVSDQPTLKLGSIVALCRHTSVFVLEAGEWRIVQHHFSIGVSNDVVFGSERAKLG